MGASPAISSRLRSLLYAVISELQQDWVGLAQLILNKNVLFEDFR